MWSISCLMMDFSRNGIALVYMEYLVVNSLWPSDAIWRHRFRSVLAQVVACCLMAPSHYLNQCWLSYYWGSVAFTWEISRWVPKLLFFELNLKIILLKLLPHLPGANELSEGFIAQLCLSCTKPVPAGTMQHWYHPTGKWLHAYCQTSDIRHTLVGKQLADHSDLVGASPVATAPTTSTSSFLI